MVERFRWDRCDPHQPWARVGRHRLDRQQPPHLHAHDFAEWCWVEAGVIEHGGCGGGEHLHPGDARFLRPGSIHSVHPTADGDVLVTASIPGPLFDELERRYRGHAAWPWPAHGHGAMHLGIDQRASLDALVAGIPLGGQERADAEWLVAGLLRILRGGPGQGTAPDWLAAAIAGMSTQRRLAGGLPELVRLCGRSPAHISRAVRKAYDCTATELVHRLRCQYAARELRLGTRPIVDIAADCGYVHVGHFYRRFGAVFGCAPRAYRQAALGG